ncbi:hypothetical protein [Neptuniibacter pectenicola]|jgi:hypothetical protein|uniref:hypothetical protein n=1 Tax=Neptuniibacter pectenicola TaxID=1806669 RepID=UPI0030EBCA2C|tara:strand:+ start:826 stop:1122 length:297 start_codon:yes stop_codon:yes gene_type:complete
MSTRIFFDKIKNDTQQLISDIENELNLESVSERYTQLKTEVGNSLKLNDESKDQTYAESILEFYNRLKASAGSNDHKKIFNALIDGFDLLEWTEKHSE